MIKIQEYSREFELERPFDSFEDMDELVKRRLYLYFTGTEGTIKLYARSQEEADRRFDSAENFLRERGYLPCEPEK